MVLRRSAFLAALPLLMLPAAAAQQDPVELCHGGVVAETWTAADADGELRPHFRYSLDRGAHWSRARATSYDLLLRYAVFDPLRDPQPWVPPALAADPEDRLWIVQYAIKGVQPWREEIRALGGEQLRFLGHHANLWRMDAATAEQVRALPFVRWVGAFHPAYKLEDALLDAFHAGSLLPGRYNLVTAGAGAEQKAPLVEQVQALGGTLVEAHASDWIVSALLSPQALLELARNPLVLAIDRWGAPGTDMDNARIFFGAAQLESAAGYTGQGVVGHVIDSGLDASHVDWSQPPVLLTAAGFNDTHGTCTYGINFAAGLSAPGRSRGMLPDAQGLFSVIGQYGDRYLHTQSVMANHGAVYQSNSWGSARTSAYTSVSQAMDQLVFELDFAVCQSQSNSGNPDSRPEAWAKNVISVGAVQHFDDLNPLNDQWGGGASTGPAADGRIKPDVAAWYDEIWTSDADPGGYVTGDDYMSFGGTSAATPVVGGALGLIHQMWANGDFGNATNGNPLDVYGNRPHFTTAKALLVNSAWQWPFSGVHHDLTRVHQGWGAPDLGALWEERARTLVIDEQEVLGDGEGLSWALLVPPGLPELDATLVYADPPGSLATLLHRVNDLSLKLVAPDGSVYWGNHGLLAENFSQPGGAPNDRDTVERVVVDQPAAGVWLLTVYADELNEDGHLETPELDADFALVVSPVGGALGAQRVDTIDLSGPAQPTAGSSALYQYAGAPPAAPTWLAWSLSDAGQLFQGHLFDLGAPATVAAQGVSDAAGSGSWALAFPAGASGRTVHLEVAAKVAGQWSDSQALRVDVQ